MTNILLVRSNGAQNNPEGECGIIRLRIAEQLKMNVEHRTSNPPEADKRRTSNRKAEFDGRGQRAWGSHFCFWLLAACYWLTIRQKPAASGQQPVASIFERRIRLRRTGIDCRTLKGKDEKKQVQRPGDSPLALHRSVITKRASVLLGGRSLPVVLYFQTTAGIQFCCTKG